MQRGNSFFTGFSHGIGVVGQFFNLFCGLLHHIAHQNYIFCRFLRLVRLRGRALGNLRNCLFHLLYCGCRFRGIRIQKIRSLKKPFALTAKLCHHIHKLSSKLRHRAAHLSCLIRPRRQFLLSLYFRKIHMGKPSHYIRHLQNGLYDFTHKQIGNQAGNNHHDNRSHRAGNGNLVHCAHQLVFTRSHDQNTMPSLRHIIGSILPNALEIILHNIGLGNNSCGNLLHHPGHHFIFHRLSHFFLRRVIKHRTVRCHQIGITGIHTLQSQLPDGICKIIIIGCRIISLYFDLGLQLLPVGNRQIVKITLIQLHHGNAKIAYQHHRQTGHRNGHCQHHSPHKLRFYGM